MPPARHERLQGALMLIIAVLAVLAGFTVGRLIIDLRSDALPAGPSTDELYRGWF